MADPEEPEDKLPRHPDDAVSLEGLDFEEALKALLAVDPNDPPAGDEEPEK